MPKVVINRCYGGFGLSDKAVQRLIELGMPQDKAERLAWEAGDKERTNPLLVQVVEELEADANGTCAQLKIVTIPDDVAWYIHDYDGIESVYEEHRTWS